MGSDPGRCPACNRFIGPLDECPYCDCPSERRDALRRLRAAALALAVGGLLLLAFAVRDRELPLLQADAIRPSMNFARVRFAGVTDARPRSGATRQGERWFNITASDDTGRVTLSAFGAAAEALESRLSASGTPVRVQGVLSIRAGRLPAIRIEKPEDLEGGEAP